MTESLALEALVNVLKRKRQERLDEEIKAQKAIAAARVDKSLMPKNAWERVWSLSKEIALLEQAIEVARDEPRT